MIRRSIAIAIIVLITVASIFAENIEFYATVSSSTDTNMIKMSTDLLFTQLQSMEGYTIIDKRNEKYNAEKKSKNISFYAEIQEEDSGKWTCTLNAFKNNAAFSSTKEYNSYYKILMDTKLSLENFILNLSGNIVIPEKKELEIADSNENINTQEEMKKNNPILEHIAGTWIGEDLIEKILILRSGRGFVIYKNGATMNITICIEGSEITIRQNGKPNASFYPELPRQVALKNAESAKPIEWKLSLKENTLSGIKKTLISDKKSSSLVTEGTINVSWTKQK